MRTSVNMLDISMWPRTAQKSKYGSAKHDCPIAPRQNHSKANKRIPVALAQMFGPVLAFALLGTCAYAAPRAAIIEAVVSEPDAADLSATADTLPPMPMPHPKRASETRRAAYSVMLKTWVAVPPRATDATKNSNLTISKPEAAVETPAAITLKQPNGATGDAGSSRSKRSDVALPSPSSSSANRESSAMASSADKVVPPLPMSRKAAQVPDDTLPSPEQKSAELAAPDAWSRDEIASAEQVCESLLEGVAAEVDRIDPLRRGSCGTPKPLRLRRIGSGAGLSVEPAATTNCAVAARLYQWLETVAQPAAKKAFGSRIVKVSNASSYMCRNRYNDPAQKISEHAFANALDISSFELADGRTIDVKRFWGLVVESEEAQRLAQAAPAAGGAGGVTKTAAKPSGLGARAVTSGLSEKKPDEMRAGKPEPRTNETAELAFLKEIHSGACGIFSTVLGPEANRAHHDHFHFDLKQRRGAAYCE